MIFVVKTFHWRPSKVVMGWIRTFNHHNFETSPCPPKFARPSSPTNAGIVFEGEGVNPSLEYKDRLSLTLMWTCENNSGVYFFFCSSRVFLPGRFPEQDLAMCPLLCWLIGNSPGFSDFGELLWCFWQFLQMCPLGRGAQFSSLLIWGNWKSYFKSNMKRLLIRRLSETLNMDHSNLSR